MAYAHKLVDASDIHHFADRRPREAQGFLPDIIRRLLEATPGVEGLTAPGGDGIITQGWDICVDNAPASPYIPGGQSRWELGTNSDPNKKATQDFADQVRNLAQQGVDPSETTVVFVQMRRWTTKLSWRDRRRTLGIWRGVEVKDAHDIHDWLSTHPNVHRWVTEQIRKSLDGVSSTPLAQLPRDVPDFVGRKETLDALMGTADRANSVVITGTPGVGKTALAVHFAHRHSSDFPDGQLYVDLRGTHDNPATPATVVADLLRELGAEDALNRGLDEQINLYRSLCHDKRLIIVLDNAADEAQVRSLLPGGFRCLALVTSRSSLSGLDGVHRVPLTTLQPLEALDMLAAITDAERVSAEYPSASQICELCGYLPLALRIAGTLATKRRGWSLSNLANRLLDEHRRLDQLKAGDIAVRASFHLSYRRLNPTTQLVFRRIPLVPGPDFDLAQLSRATNGVAEDTLDDQLEILAELNLIGYGSRDGRYTIHDLLRLYADETLNATDSSESVNVARNEVLTYLLDTATRLSIALNPEIPIDQSRENLQEALAWLDDNIGNIVPAHSMAIKQRDFNLATSTAIHLSGYFSRRSSWSTAIPLIESTLNLVQGARNLPGYQHETGNIVELILLQELCTAAVYLKDYTFATNVCDQIDELGTRTGNPLALAGALNHRGDICKEQHQHTEALGFFEEALQVLREADAPTALESLIRHNIGIVRSYLGRTDEGLADLEHDLEACRRRGNIEGEAHTLNSIGLAKLRAGDAQGAERALREAIDKFAQRQEIREEANAQNDLGIVLNNSLNKPSEALECHLRDLEICDQLEDSGGSARAHIQIAICLINIDIDNFTRAAEHLRKVTTLVNVETDPVAVAHATIATGDLHSAVGQPEIALTAYSEAVTLAEQCGDRASQAMSMSKRGDMLAKLGRYGDALPDLSRAAEIFGDEHLSEDESTALRSLADATVEAEGQR